MSTCKPHGPPRRSTRHARRFLLLSLCASHGAATIAVGASAQGKPAEAPATRETSATATENDATATYAPPELTYRTVLAEAIKEFNAGLFIEARSLFKRAHAIRPSGQTWRALALTDYELRRYDESVHAFEQALAETKRPLDSTERTDAERLLQRANNYVGRYYVAKHTAGEPLEASIDGRAAIVAADGAILVPIGQHRLRVGKDEWALDVWGGERSQLADLQPHNTASEPVVRTTTGSPADATGEAHQPSAFAQASQSAPVADKAFPWGPALVTVGGGVLVASGAVMGGLAVRAKRDFEELCPANASLCSLEARDKRDQTRRLALASDVLWGSGLAVAATGLLWLWFASDDETPENQATVRAVPQTAGLGVDIYGRF